ncbi:MAG: sigma-70 family RNA polymerase sigma factor [Muribaculaceae bacterium]|nr:sigma-70 family RNA polymerase sigma factor [Muribaculaceae bacterium]
MVRRGDPSAMKAIYCAYAGYLTGVCTRYISDNDDVKDILHDAFLKIFAAVGKFEYRGAGSLKAWLTRVTVNEALKAIRRNHRAELMSMTTEPADAPAEDPETSSIDAATLHSLIRNLPLGYRTVFNLYVMEEKSHKEIASILGISESTSASQLHRAKAMLAGQIKKRML